MSRNSLSEIEEALGVPPEYVYARVRKWGKGFKREEIEVPVELVVTRDGCELARRVNGFSTLEAAKAWDIGSSWKLFKPSELVSVYGSIYQIAGEAEE